MFWSVPSSRNEIITNTPIDAKSIRAIFFENKNDGCYHYGSNTDTITVSIDNKIICRDLIILPFLTLAPNQLDRFDWNKIALEVNMNVNNSEVKISGLRNNDFNIIFVYDTLQVDESKGYDFIETKVLRLRVPEDDGSFVPPYTNWTQYYTFLRERSKRLTQNAKENQEMILSFDYEPKSFFAYPVYSRFGDDRVYPFHDDLITFNLYGADNEIIPQNLDMQLVTANQKIAWRECAWKFGDLTKKNMVMSINFGWKIRNDIRSSTFLIGTNRVQTLDIIFCFIYKKLS